MSKNGSESLSKDDTPFECLRDRLVDIRTKGYGAAGKAAPLWFVLGIDKCDSDYMKALLIYLIPFYIDKSLEMDIILMAFGLLKGYERILTIGERRRVFISKSNYVKDMCKDLYQDFVCNEETRKEAIRLAEQRLPKKEYEFISTLADRILNITDLPALLKDVPRHPVYPSPNYLATSDATEITVPETVSEIHILTPNVSRWEDEHILGRDIFVKILCQELQTDMPHLQLTGMGGIGKSKILHKVYTNFSDTKNVNHFSHVGLIYYSGSMHSNLAEQIKCPGGGNAEAVWDYLRGLCDKAPVLLLIDDIRPRQSDKSRLNESDDSFDNLFTLNVAVLMASRTLLEKFENKTVEPLTMEQCVQVFQDQRNFGVAPDKVSSLSKEEPNLLRKIIHKRAGYNTLIVNRLGAMARDYKLSIAELSDRLKNQGFNMIKGNKDEEKLQEEINKLYSLDGINKPVDRSILEAFALFPVILLIQNACIKWLQEDAGADEDICRLTLSKLSSQTWLTLHEGAESETVSYSMHQMVKSAITAQANIEFDKHIKLIAHCRDAISFSITESFMKVQPYIPFAVSLAHCFISEKRVEIADLMNNIGRFLAQTADFDQALKWHEKALSIREQLLGTDHTDTATSYHNIGRVYDGKGKYPLALEWYYKALPIREKVLGLEHPDSAETYHRIGFAYHRTDYPESLKWYEKALAIREKVFGTEHLITAESYHGIAGIYTRQGKYAEALKLYDKSMRIRENNLNPENTSIAISYSCIAQVYIRQRNATESLKWDNKALAIREKFLGEAHPNTAATYNHIAKAHTMLGQFDFALKMHFKALEVRKKTIGTEHAYTATTYNDIGEVYFLQGNYAEALTWYGKALTVRQDTLGAESAPAATSYFNIAKVLEKQEKHAEAQELYQRALIIREKVLGEEHLSTADAYFGIAGTYAFQGNNSQALAYYMKALKIFESQLGNDDDRTKNTRMIMLDIEKSHKR